MKILLWIFVLVGTLFCSLLITWLYRRYALAKSLMDIPNDRSSHIIPTPRGGGVGIVMTWVIVISLLREYLDVGWADYCAFIVPAILLAIVSYIDDRSHVKPLWRLFFQVAIASLAVYCVGGVQFIHVMTYEISTPWLLTLMAIVGLVWLINLYNFMDGIDGIAGLTAISVSISLFTILWLTESTSEVFSFSLIFIAAVMGFLWFNFPKASIFMGDIGSCFLGLTLGLFILKAGQSNQALYWAMCILLGTFILDATITLVRRALRGQKIYMAHREHAYQHLSRRWNSHPTVTLVYSAITLMILLPISILIVEGHLDGLIGLLMVYVPLGLWLWHSGAGMAQSLKPSPNDTEL